MNFSRPVFLRRSVGLSTAAVLLLLAGCGGGGPRTIRNAAPQTASGLSQAEIQDLWGKAMGLFRHGKWAKASTQFERVSLEVPSGDTLAISAHFYLGECYLGQGSQLQAAREFRKVSDDYPNAPLAPLALLRAGDAYGDLWRRVELDDSYAQTAKATYQELLNRYPDSPEAPRARLRMADLEDGFAKKEFQAAQYYMRLKAYDSAILYLKDIAATYPKAKITPQALLRLVEAYRIVGYAEDRRETCGYIRRFHPGTPGLDGACPAPADSAAAGS